METLEEYIAHTKSAVQHLFGGVDAYLQILRSGCPPILDGSYSSEAERDAALKRWKKEKNQEIQKALEAERTFLAEKYALAVLCGSLLQIASMAIRLYSKNKHIPAEWSGSVNAKLSAYCIGRLVRKVPLGLVIYAGRNQYNHIDEDQLHEPNRSVFEWLATRHEYGESIRDPAFDLKTGFTWNYPSNITSLIGWRDYKTYEKDMLSLLGSNNPRNFPTTDASLIIRH
ncbi:MAG: hypothetical protein ABL970_02315 [Nitrospira sp.]